jgi:hypothetical protein
VSFRRISGVLLAIFSALFLVMVAVVWSSFKPFCSSGTTSPETYSQGTGTSFPWKKLRRSLPHVPPRAKHIFKPSGPRAAVFSKLHLWPCQSVDPAPQISILPRSPLGNIRRASTRHLKSLRVGFTRLSAVVGETHEMHAPDEILPYCLPR